MNNVNDNIEKMDKDYMSFNINGKYLNFYDDMSYVYQLANIYAETLWQYLVEFFKIETFEVER